MAPSSFGSGPRECCRDKTTEMCSFVVFLSQPKTSLQRLVRGKVTIYFTPDEFAKNREIALSHLLVEAESLPPAPVRNADSFFSRTGRAR